MRPPKIDAILACLTIQSLLFWDFLGFSFSDFPCSLAFLVRFSKDLQREKPLFFSGFPFAFFRNARAGGSGLRQKIAIAEQSRHLVHSGWHRFRKKATSKPLMDRREERHTNSLSLSLSPLGARERERERETLWARYCLH